MRVTELYNRVWSDQELFVPQLVYGYKLRLEGKEPPCRIKLNFEGKLSSTNVHVYVSHDNKEPNSSTCMEKHTNPPKPITIKGVINPKT